MELQVIHDWLLNLSDDYSVNPYTFAAIYVGAIPLFIASVAWIIRNRKRGKPVTLPLLSTGLWMSSSYIYLFIAGDNIPGWVYILAIGFLVYGVYSTVKRITREEENLTV